MTAAVAGACTIGCSWRVGITLLAFFGASSRLTHFRMELKDVDESHRAGGQRDWQQVWCCTTFWPLELFVTMMTYYNSALLSCEECHKADGQRDWQQVWCCTTFWPLELFVTMMTCYNSALLSCEESRRADGQRDWQQVCSSTTFWPICHSDGMYKYLFVFNWERPTRLMGSKTGRS